ncbi:LysM peptidoglycan-binding domain-containing protein [Thermoflexibacter ruber]|uniref:LysM domain-containing protein n=1 Tax=Thermoflexibacter ruber TaxID=1003 RepID=A0A1I2J9L1_9BACT|nr:LysM domain-containing protein [Thermoflexibacter ruber]SFF50523.1 hypothetical protein SAMN04488541_104330 [Thermoflexibacter ruber]
MSVEEKEKVISKTTLITAMSVFFLSIFIIFLFLSSKEAWQQKIKEASTYPPEIEDLRKENTTLKAKLDFYRKQDSVYTKLIATRTFDAKDTENFRMYGLFKDKDKKYTPEEMAAKFNIPNEKAIKITEVQGDNWFIIPVKGVHFVRKAETASSIAKKYYTLLRDSVLIKEFNPSIKIDNLVFIPYGSENTK